MYHREEENVTFLYTFFPSSSSIPRSKTPFQEVSMCAGVIITVLLEYFAGEKPLRMSQISRKFDPLRSNYCVLARIVCIY